MAKKAFPRHESGLATAIQEDILLPHEPTPEVNWPVQTIRLDRKTGTLIVDVGKSDLVDRLVEESTLSELGQHGFQPTLDPHMTIINYENGWQIIKALNSSSLDQRAEMLQAVENMAENEDWSWRPIGELQPFRGRKKRALKIITRVECPAFDSFYEDLGRLVPTAKFKLYQPHITLLKRSGEVSWRTPSTIGGVALNRPLLSL